MRYPCLVFDHDDTTVDSTRNVHYPCFVEYMKKHRPELRISLEEYVKYNFHPGVLPFFREICGLSEEELIDEQEYWNAYCGKHRSEVFPGIREIMEKQKTEGGMLVVVSHSYRDNLLKDYERNHLPMPDRIFGWEQPPEERKPSPAPLFRIMEELKLRREDILVIDDLKPGLVMAREAGVDFAAAGWCFDIPENESYMREKADVYCKTVEELRRFLLEERIR